jgi:1-acyl-sn-glycerol-3-phosphate acyltransferase
MHLTRFTPARRQAFVGYDGDAARDFFERVEHLSKRLHIEVTGMENLPKGRALLVANHAFGWDIVFAMSAIRHHTGRPVFALGEHLWWRIPWLRRLAAAVGTVDGTPENTDRLLSHDELVVVMPGGLREAVKPRQLRYRLLWGERYGFIRAAIRNQAPLVPVAAIGADDWFDFEGDAVARGKRWLRFSGLPIPKPSRFLPIPHFRPLRYVIGEPIQPRAARDRECDPEVLKRLRREVEGALYELIDDALAKRAGVAI